MLGDYCSTWYIPYTQYIPFTQLYIIYICIPCIRYIACIGYIPFNGLYIIYGIYPCFYNLCFTMLVSQIKASNVLFFFCDSNQVLCVKEAHETINSYKIMIASNAEANKSNDSDSEGSHSYYIYGKEDCLFISIPKILEFYSTHYLNQSPLIKPVSWMFRFLFLFFVFRFVFFRHFTIRKLQQCLISKRVV